MLYEITNPSHWNVFDAGDVIWNGIAWVVVYSTVGADYPFECGLATDEDTFYSTNNLLRVSIDFLYSPQEWGVGDGFVYLITSKNEFSEITINGLSGSTVYVVPNPKEFVTGNFTLSIHERGGWDDGHHAFENGFMEFTINEPGHRLVAISFARLSGDYATLVVSNIKYETSGSPAVWTSYINTTEYFS